MGGRRVDLGPPKQRAVLAVLLTEANHVVSLDRLIDLLWGDDAPARATGALQVYVSGLRRVLEPRRAARTPSRVLITQPPGYLLRAERDDIDAWRFEDLAAQGRKLLAESRPRAARRALTEALALWRGPALADFAFEPFARAESTRLDELRATTLEDRMEADLALGDHAGVTAELEAAVAESPLRERRWALLMLALYRSHRQADALRAGVRAREYLVGELGVEPGPLLRDLEADILAQSPTLDWRPPAEPEPPVVAVRPGAGPSSPGPALGPDAADADEPVIIVGRHRELEELEGALVASRQASGGVVLISGEPGIGKTRLVEELATEADRQGSLVGWGRCQEGGRTLSFWPWVQVIRNLLRVTDEHRLRAALAPRAIDLVRVVPEITTLLPDLGSPPMVAPYVARFRLQHAVAGTLAALAADQPVVVCLEDLHWADAPSLRLLEFVAEQTAGTSLLLAVTYRDVDPAVAYPLAEALGSLARHPGLRRVHLGGLAPAEVRQFMARTAGVDPTEAVVDAVYARTDGNPFFVAELTRLLASEGELTSADAFGREVPAAVRDVVRRRLGRLPEQTNDLLGLAAVLGREVDLAVLAAASGLGEGEVLDLIDASVAVGILVDEAEPAGQYRFSHAIVQETVSDELGRSRRAQVHARAAHGLQQVHGDDDGRAVEVAHHFRAAVPVVDVETAIAATLRAAEVAQRRLAYEVAELSLHRALALVVRLPVDERPHRELEIQHRLAALLSLTTGYQSAEVAEAWGRARELSHILGDTPEVLSSLWGLARLARTRAEFASSVKFGEQLLDLAQGSPVTAFAVAGHETFGTAAFFTGDPEAAAFHLTKAVSLSDSPDFTAGSATLVLNPRIVCRAYLACARWILGQGHEADDLFAQATARLDDEGGLLDRALVFLYSCKLATMRGRSRVAVEWAAEVRGLAETAAIGPLASVGTILGAWATAHEGGPRQAKAVEASVHAAMADLRASEWRLAWTYFLALLADVQRVAAELDGALATVDEGLAEAAATGERYHEAELLRLGAEVRAAQGGGAAAEAEDWIHRAVEIADAQGSVAFRAKAVASLARLRGG